MSTIFVITFGTSDVQFEKTDIENSEFELINAGAGTDESFFLKPKRGHFDGISLKKNRGYDSFLPKSPRLDGKLILDHIKDYLPIISLPLIMPVIKKVIEQGNQIGKFILVYTDQQDALERHWLNDSVYFAEVFKNMIQAHFEGYNDQHFPFIAIREKANNIDHQYITLAKTCESITQAPSDETTMFAKKNTNTNENSKHEVPSNPKQKIITDEIHQVILLAQGGMDQINHALTLQLIQAFGYKLVIYQKAEGTSPVPLDFTRLFLQDFIKQQVNALVQAADYHGALLVLNLHENKSFDCVKTLIQFAGFRKLFLYKEANKIAATLAKNKIGFLADYVKRKRLPEFLTGEIQNHEFCFFIAERFYLADFYFARAKYSDFVLAFQIFYETFCNHYISSVYNIDLSSRYRSRFSELLNKIRDEEPETYLSASELLKLKETPLTASFPALASLSIVVSGRQKHTAVREALEPLLHINSQFNGYSGSNGLDILRNNIAHGGKGVLEQDLYLASNVRDRRDNLKYWKDVMEKLRGKFITNQNPYDEMNAHIADKLRIIY